MSEITPERVAHLKHLLASVGDLPWFLADCEGDMQIWRESALQRVSRECSGEIIGYSTPSSYKRNDLVAGWDLDTWDEGEDEDDDERRRMAELIVESVNLLPHLLTALETAQADQAESAEVLTAVSLATARWRQGDLDAWAALEAIEAAVAASDDDTEAAQAEQERQP
ncbi:hypothetical protein ABZ897_00480 [Nonomuraea sp. NPDC046802]|uniref:hypothetical protein n=1 Tax=Nonomuraea sp. NPDC046802 TaxID=3154919 RepID=UPI0033DDD346